MISLPPGTKVYLASKPVSMRLGFDGLAALVRPLFDQVLGQQRDRRIDFGAIGKCPLRHAGKALTRDVAVGRAEWEARSSLVFEAELQRPVPVGIVRHWPPTNRSGALKCSRGYWSPST